MYIIIGMDQVRGDAAERTGRVRTESDRVESSEARRRPVEQPWRSARLGR